MKDVFVHRTFRRGKRIRMYTAGPGTPLIEIILPPKFIRTALAIAGGQGTRRQSPPLQAG